MEKRQNRSTLLFSLGFLLTLVCAVGSFLYGMQIGIGRTETKYRAMREEALADASRIPASQQDLVTFYHTVFSPYREFQSEWLSAEAALAQGKLRNAGDTFEKLSKLAAAKYDEAGSVDMQRFQLIGEAQTFYLRSLRLFGDAAESASGSAKNLTGTELRASIAGDAGYQSAVKQELAAQQSFYSGMLKWSASVNEAIPADFAYRADLKLTEWSKLPLPVKIKAAADGLLSLKLMTEYYPHDLASKIDGFIASGQAEKLKLTAVSQVIELLNNTGAVRTGDFVAAKSSFYAKELLPVIPFFS